MSSALGALVAVQTGPKPTEPPAVLSRPVYTEPERIELHLQTPAARYDGPDVSRHNPDTPGDLEASPSSSPTRGDVAAAAQSFSNPPMNRWRMISCCLMCFGNGMNDSGAAFITDYLQAHLGRAKTLMLALATMMLGSIMVLCSPPFPVVVISFLFFGLGEATNLALNNVFVANLANSTTAMGAFHGSYGIGGIVAPLIATAMISHGARWSHFYSISLGIAAVNLGFAGWSFWFYDQEYSKRSLTALERTASQQAALTTDEPKKLQVLKQAVKNKVTILGALFIFAYQGAEVSISGWVISFLINYRGGNPYEVGYVTAGFWAGITVGRFALTPPAHKIGERPFVYALVIGAVAFQLLVWLVPNVVGDAGKSKLSLVKRKFFLDAPRVADDGALQSLSPLLVYSWALSIPAPWPSFRDSFHVKHRCPLWALFQQWAVLGAPSLPLPPAYWRRPWAHLFCIPCA
ncbi:MAG: hypothetical protein M1812_001910 [Candelaria pacifica]|nr:MAG: hypothetical protein M1812_001910 [Candelaria pacifica]